MARTHLSKFFIAEMKVIEKEFSERRRKLEADKIRKSNGGKRVAVWFHSPEEEEKTPREEARPDPWWWLCLQNLKSA